MITIKLQGGLGNQLFQWAAGLHLTEVHGIKVRYDTVWFDTTGPRDTPRDLEIASLIEGQRSRAPGFVKAYLWNPRWPWYVSEQERGDLDYVQRGRLIGYFQDARIVNAVRQAAADRLREQGFVARATHEATIGLHIRLGDYFHDPRTRAHHGLLSPGYFASAVKLLEPPPSAEIVVFTDDVEVFDREYSQVLELPWRHSSSVTGREALLEMSGLESLVISNSSLSWWAAWAPSAAHAKSVVYPRPWLAQATAFDTRIPMPDWIPLDRPDEESW